MLSIGNVFRFLIRILRRTKTKSKTREKEEKCKKNWKKFSKARSRILKREYIGRIPQFFYCCLLCVPPPTSPPVGKCKLYQQHLRKERIRGSKGCELRWLIAERQGEGWTRKRRQQIRVGIFIWLYFLYEKDLPSAGCLMSEEPWAGGPINSHPRRLSA